MNLLKINIKKLLVLLETYEEVHGKKGIIVCNEKTKDLIIKEPIEISSIQYVTISSNCFNSNEEKEKPSYVSEWQGFKIITYNGLEDGEIRIA